MDRSVLRKTLEGHKPADDLEATHRRRMLALLDSAGDPFARDHFEPGHFTASAFVLSPGGDRLLLIHHAKLGLWLQPGGHVNAGDEDIFAAANRELLEETALKDCLRDSVYPELLDVDIHRIPANPRKGEPAHEHFDIRVLLRSPHEEVTAGSDALDARWVQLDGVEAVATDDSVMRAVRKIRRG